MALYAIGFKRLPAALLLALAVAAAAAEVVMPHRLTLLPDQPQQVDGLTLTVVEIVEKRLTDGASMMRVRVLAAGRDRRLLEFTSETPVLEWAGLRFRYVGGWRSEVQLDIEPMTSESTAVDGASITARGSAARRAGP